VNDIKLYSKILDNFEKEDEQSLNSLDPGADDDYKSVTSSMQEAKFEKLKKGFTPV